MRLAILTSDNREGFKTYSQATPCFGAAPEALLQGLSTLPELEVHVVSCLQQPVPIPEQKIGNIHYHALHVPKIGWLRTGYQGCIRAVRRKLREIQPDIVHGQGTERDCAISAVFSGFPNVLTIHGNMKAVAEYFHARPGSFLWVAAKLETVTLRRSTGIFCNSRYTEKQAAPRARKTWLVPNAVRKEFFMPLPERPSVVKPVLLNVGNVLPYKQQCELLEVAGKLHRRGFRFEFKFAGERALQTDYGAEFTRRLAVAEQEGYAQYLGVLPTRQLIGAMDTASALIHFPTEEAFGLVVTEALARNLKLFGATTGGVVDIARDIEGAELFSAQNFSALEDAIASWLSSGGRRPQKATQIMRERYHPEIIARRHLEIYREVPGH